jgi:uncharacterized protein (DUF697 family)
MFDNLKGALGVWNIVRGVTSSEVRRQMEMPVSLLIVGDEEQRLELSRRLGSPAAEHASAGTPVVVGGSQLVLDASKLARLDQDEFAAELAIIAAANKDRQIALASHVPAFRSVVVHQLSHDRAFENAKAAGISALPGVIPLTDWLMPVTAAGDMLFLTRNQIILLLEVAACYGKPPEPRARLKELLPVVGGAFGWRAVARELVGLVPGGVGVVVKAALAYAGTYSVGRAAAYYYSGGTAKLSTEQMRTFYRSALVEGMSRGRALLKGS